MLPQEDPHSCSRSDHHCGPSSQDPKQGGPFKILPFELKEMKSDTYVFKLEHAVNAYFKGAHVPDHTERNLFFEALSGQQRNAIGCQKIARTYTARYRRSEQLICVCIASDANSN